MQGFWGKRLVALIIDIAIITLFLWVLVAILYPLIAAVNIYQILRLWLPLTAVLIIIYFTYFEGRYGVTPGKSVMKLKVKSLEGNMNYWKAFIRNLSKIFWLPLIVDVIIGFVLGSPRRRVLDRLAKTAVFSTDEKEVSLDREAEEITVEKD